MENKEIHSLAFEKIRVKTNYFRNFFENQNPLKVKKAINFIEDIKHKNIDEIELAIKLTNDGAIKHILKEILIYKMTKL